MSTTIRGSAGRDDKERLLANGDRWEREIATNISLGSAVSVTCSPA